MSAFGSGLLATVPLVADVAVVKATTDLVRCKTCGRRHRKGSKAHMRHVRAQKRLDA